MVRWIRWHASRSRPRPAGMAGSAFLRRVPLRVSCAVIALSCLLGTGRGFRPSATGSPSAQGLRQGSFRPSCHATMTGVESPTAQQGERLTPSGRAREGPRKTRLGVRPGWASNQAGAEGQASEVGAAPASGLIADAVQVRSDRAHALARTYLAPAA